MRDKELIYREDAKARKVYCDERHEYVVPVAEIDWLHPVVPHEMTAVEYIHISNRMLKEDYRAWDRRMVFEGNDDADKAVALVEEWAREHPERSGE